MKHMVILKTSSTKIFHMNPKRDAERKERELPNDEEPADLGAKALHYALINRPSPPF